MHNVYVERLSRSCRPDLPDAIFLARLVAVIQLSGEFEEDCNYQGFMSQLMTSVQLITT